MTYTHFRHLSFLLLLLLQWSPGSGQIYLQLERANITDVRRFTVGTEIRFKTVQYDGWQEGLISKLIYEDQAIVFPDGISYLEDFTHFSYERPQVKFLGDTQFYFGASWLVLGGLIEGLRRIDVLETQYEFGVDTAVIGASAMLSGYLTKAIWGRAVKKMNKQNRVRIVDLRP
ncbi:MAG: hypothetical protein AAFR14_01600 [Bacteroidota bacterium]